MEVCYNNEFATVCDNSWDDNDARVVCKQLGLPSDGEAGIMICSNEGYVG